MFDLTHHGKANEIDPACLTKQGQLYVNQNKRQTNEKAVISHCHMQAKRDVIYGQISLVQEGSSIAVPHIAEIKNESPSLHSLGGSEISR